jgi:ATP-binding cassette subfamily B protein
MTASFPDLRTAAARASTSLLRRLSWWRDGWSVARLLGAASGGPLAAYIVLLSLGVVLPPALAFVEGRLIGSVTAYPHVGRVPWALTVCFAALFLGIVVRAPAAVLAGRLVSRQIDARLRARVTRATAGSAVLDWMERPDSADAIRRVAGGTGAAAVAFADSCAVLAGGLAGVAILASFSLPLALLLGASVVGVRRYAWSRGERLGESMNAGTGDLRRGKYWASVAAGSWAAKEVRLFGLSDWAVAACREDARRGMAIRWAPRTRFLGEFASVTFVVLTAAFTLVALFLGVSLASGNIGAGTLVFLLSGASVAGSAIGSAPAKAAELNARVGAMRGLAELESTARPARRAAAVAPPPRQSIVFDAVSFAYPGAAMSALEKVDLVIPVGRSVAIVGANGAGKTTLVKLLAGLYRPSGGRILLDGADLAAFDLHAWRNNIAAIFQNFIRYPLPARDNVGLGAAPASGDPTDAPGIAEAAARAGLDALVERLPRGWDTTLSTEYRGGSELSGGEWQRVALARAFVGVGRGRSILVLDEPTANLDVRAEAAFYESFLDVTRGMTTVLISHRFASVRQADVIYVLDRGRVVESGSHASLVAEGGRYAAMYGAQAASFAPSPLEEAIAG